MKRKMKLPVLILLIVSIFALVFSFAINSSIKTFITNQKEVTAPANWYTDYTYTLNNTNHTITLTRYNGTATDVVVGATATISGVTYNTVVVGNDTRNNALFANCQNIKKITFENGIKAGENMLFMFYNCTSLEEVVFNNINTTNTTSLRGMFLNCSSLMTVDFSSFNTSNVTDLSSMFQGCTSIKDLDFSSFETSRVTTMRNFLYRARNLENLDISSFDTSGITTDNGMYNFGYLTSVKKLKIGEKTNFHIRDNTNGYPFIRGIYQRVEDGKEFNGVDIMEYAPGSPNSEQYAGTYIKTTNIIDEMITSDPVTYRIDNFNGQVEATTSNNFEYNNNSLYIASVTKPSSQNYHVSGYAEIIFNDAVIDEFENKYDLKIRIDNVYLYDFNSLNFTDMTVLLMQVDNSNLDLIAQGFTNTNLTTSLSINDIKFDVTISILDQSGSPVDGNYLLSGYDLDMPSKRDSTGYELYNEGINIIEGVDLNSIILHSRTYLVKENRTISGQAVTRISGSRADNGTELSEFVAVADASKLKFSYTGSDCGSSFFSYYQPRMVEIEKQDDSGNILPGAELELYKESNSGNSIPFKSWTSTNAPQKVFLNPGKYVVSETSSPTGYNPSEDILFYAVISDKLSLNGEEVDKIIVKNHKKEATLIVKYVDQDGHDIDPTKNRNESVHWFDSYSSSQLTFANYNFVEVTGDLPNGTINKDLVEIIYHYSLKPATLIVKYVDQNGDNIDPTKNRNEAVHYGDSYTSSELSFTNYNFVNRTGDPASGTIAKDHVEVVYHYALKPATLKVRYVDEHGDDIDPSKNRNESVHYGDTYATSQLAFTNYRFVERTGDAASGTISKDLVEVVYHYELCEAVLSVRYVDQDGYDIDITKNRNESVHYGDSYTSSQLTFTNYNFVERTGDPASGIINKDYVEIIYHYELKSSTLVVKYVDENGDDIDPTKNRNEAVHYGDSYTSSELSFTNYNFVERTGDAASGTISKDSYEIIYHYALKPATLVVKYVDQDGHDIDPTKNRNESVHWGDAYVSTPLIFGNYNYVNRTGDDPSGTIVKDHVEVIYHYELKPATLKVRYVDQDGFNIDPTKNRNEAVHYGDTYSSEQLTFNNYNFVERTGDPASGTIAKDNVEIIYHYQIKEATLVVKYVDQNGNNIDPTKNRNESVHWGDSYTSSELSFTNYNFVERTGDAASGTISKDSYEIIYHYALKDATLTIKYVDQDGNDIDPTKNTINAPKHWGDAYVSTQYTFGNYNFVELTGDDPSGIIAKDHVEVIYHYQIKEATLTIKYVDENGNSIDPTKDTINAPKHWGDTYNSSQLTFANYAFVRITGDAPSGTISKNNVEVIYHYRLCEAVLSVRYVDQDGYDIDITKNRNEEVHYGDTYTSSELTFANYNFVERTGDPASGTINKNLVEVIYHYALKPATLVVKYVDQAGNNIDPTKNRNESVHYGDAYTSTMLTFANYNFVERTGDPASGTIAKDHVEVIYHYALKPATLVVKYVDQDGNDIDPTKNRNESVHYGDSYTSSQLTFTNYNFVERTGDPASGTIAKDHIEIIYHYTLKDATLTIKYVDQDGHDIDPTKNTINAPKHWGDAYASTQLIFGNYNFVEQTGDDPSGIIAKDHVEVIYHYSLKPATLVVKYVDQDGNDIDPTKNRNESVHYGDSYTSEQLTFAKYNFVNRTGDSASGTIAKDQVEVIYHYEPCEAVLSVRYVDQNNHDIDPTKNRNEAVHYGDTYTSEQLTFTNYNFVERTGDPASGTIDKDLVEVVYHYTLKDSTLVVRYVDQNGNNIDPTKNRNEAVHYGDSYTSEQLTFANYNFVEITGDAASGTISKDSYEIIYHYQVKDANLVVKYVDQNGNNIDSSKNRNEIVHYGDTYTSEQYTFENYDFVNRTGDAASGTIAKDNYEIIYHYKLKKGTVITHHYLYDNGETTTKLADDVSNTYDYTTTYNTEASADVPSNYELYKKSNNYTGIVNSPTIDVFYYYQLKDSDIETSIDKKGPEEITAKDEEVDYKITYNAFVKEYIGDGTITIVDTLPYKIDVSKSNIANGVYDEENLTITWIEEWKNIDSYSSTNGIARKEIIKNIKLVYIGIDGHSRFMVNSVKGRIELGNNSRDNEYQISTPIKIEGKITVRYVDEDDNNLVDKIDKTGLVGEFFNSEEKEFEGYRLIKKPTSEHLEFTEEAQEIKYVYQKIVYKVITKAKEGGGIVGDEDVPYGKDSTKDKIVIKADKGYVIQEVYVNGVKLEIKPNQNKLILNQFISMKEDKLVEVTFVKESHNPETSASITIKLITQSSVIIAIIYILKKFIIKEKLHKI